MVIAIVHYVFAILFGVAILWRWVVFISEAISNRRGATLSAPGPALDQTDLLAPIIPALLDVDLSGADTGLFGGSLDLF